MEPDHQAPCEEERDVRGRLAAEAQLAGKVYRIGSLVEVMPTLPPGQGPFYDRLRELGWVYGQNIVTEPRAWGDQNERIPDLAAELIRWGAGVQQVTRTIPIVTRQAVDAWERLGPPKWRL